VVTHSTHSGGNVKSRPQATIGLVAEFRRLGLSLSLSQKPPAEKARSASTDRRNSYCQKIQVHRLTMAKPC